MFNQKSGLFTVYLQFHQTW